MSPATLPEPTVGWSAYFRQVAHGEAGAGDEGSNRPSYAQCVEAYRRSAEAPRVVQGFVSVRIAILRNATVEPWVPELFVALLRRGVKASFHVGDYSAYEQYAADPSKLGDPGPDYVFLYFDPTELAGDARHDPPVDMADTLLARIEGIVSGLVERSRAGVVVANLPPDPVATHALHGDQDPHGWQQHRRAVNLALVERLSPNPRAAILDLDRLVGDYGRSRAYDLRMGFLTRNPFAAGFLPHFADAFADVVSTFALPPKKCVVVDCDNTLWGGVLGEDGPDRLAIGTEYPGSVYREFQFFLKGLGRRGFLLAVNSKNNAGDVLTFLAESPEMVLREDDFAARRINWNDKASNIREIADELNIGLDSLVFIDDSPVECERVRTAFPEVQVEQFPSDPMAIPAFMASLRATARLHVTDDDLKRTASIRANAQREKLRSAAPDMESFIRGLQIELEIGRQDRSAVQRISQLAQRTNQFNLTTKRYAVSDLERLMEVGAVYTMSMKDRFSDYGIVGVAIATPCRGEATIRGEAAATGNAWEIDSFLMSCRAFGREIESELLRVVLADAAERGVQTVHACRVPTPKNEMTRDFYPRHGFSQKAGDGGKEERYWIEPAAVRRDLAAPAAQEEGLYCVTLNGFAATARQRCPEPRSARTP